MQHSWLLENFNYVKNLIDEDSFPNCMIITGNKCIGKKDLAQEIAKYYLDDKTSISIDSNVNYKLIKIEEGSKVIKVDQIREMLEKIYLKVKAAIMADHNISDLG